MNINMVFGAIDRCLTLTKQKIFFWKYRIQTRKKTIYC